MRREDELELQQLLQSQFWERHNQNRKLSAGPGHSDRPDVVSVPDRWELTRGLSLHAWQKQCIDAWFNAGMRGVAKVVTGAGKTVLALAIIERMQKQVPNLRVVVVVPTIVLLDQWRSELTKHSNLPNSSIGAMGGGNDDELSDDVRVLICVLNSAAKKLEQVVEQSKAGKSLLLVVDECHRAGASEMQKIFLAKREYSLGLSATPERDDERTEEEELASDFSDFDPTPKEFEDSVLGKELGPVIFELNYSDAIQLGVLPSFTIKHYGLSLNPTELSKYDGVSREIKNLRQELERNGRKGLALIRWCRSKAAANTPAAARLIALTTERKRLLFRVEERTKAVVRLLRDAFADNAETKAVLFHESIDEVMRLFELLRDEGFSIVAEHSQFPDLLRATALRLFREDTARIIVSARSLIEGFNVPSADLGIIVAASSSVRQRVQTLGRLLRRTKAKDGTEKRAVLHVLYVSKTVDEMIYEKADWEQFVGAERNQYFLWSDAEKSAPQLVEKAPRAPSPSEQSIDESVLQPGGPFPGDLDGGIALTRDTQGTIRTEDGRLIEPHPELLAILKMSHRGAGRFRVSHQRRFVIELQKASDGWKGIYLGKLTAPLKQVGEADTNTVKRKWTPGDVYPLAFANGKPFSVLQRDPRLVAKKVGGEVRFVVPLVRMSDKKKRESLEHIQSFLKSAYARGHRINKISVNAEGHVIYIYNNQAYFVGHAPDGAEGFEFEA